MIDMDDYTRDDLIACVAEFFGVEVLEDGIHNSYAWISGCYHDGTWVSLESFVDFAEYLMDNIYE